MNIGESMDAQNRAIVQLQKENADLTKQVVILKQSLDGAALILADNNELRKELQKLRDMLTKSDGRQTPRSGSHIDTGIGQISYSCSGSIDLQELMNELEKVIKNNGVRDTIRILAMAV